MISDLELRPATAEEREWCASLMSQTSPWLTYGLSVEWCRGVLAWPGSSLLIAAGQEPLGFVLAHPKGLLGNPYIAAICVAEQHRTRGVGTQILALAEETFTDSRFVYLCVSSFNKRAAKFYERNGYSKIADLPNFIADGYDEELMRKRLTI
jgi:ribosomal-protein-alanine N-acetyltransferase